MGPKVVRRLRRASRSRSLSISRCKLRTFAAASGSARPSAAVSGVGEPKYESRMRPGVSDACVGGLGKSERFEIRDVLEVVVR